MRNDNHDSEYSRYKGYKDVGIVQESIADEVPHRILFLFFLTIHHLMYIYS